MVETRRIVVVVETGQMSAAGAGRMSALVQRAPVVIPSLSRAAQNVI